MRVRFYLVSFALAILLGSTARAIDENVEFFVVPQSATVPRSGRIVFDIYARNLSDRAVIVAAPSQTRASYRLVDSQGHRFDRFFGSTGGSPHVDPPISVAPRTVFRSRFEMQVSAEKGDLVEVLFTFGVKSQAKTVSVVLFRTR